MSFPFAPNSDTTRQNSPTLPQLPRNTQGNTTLTISTEQSPPQETSHAPPSDGLSQRKHFRRSSGSDEPVHDTHSNDRHQPQSEHRTQNQLGNTDLDTNFPPLCPPSRMSTNSSSPPVLHILETDPITDTEYLCYADDFSTDSSND